MIFRQGLIIDVKKVPNQKIIKKLIEDVKKRYPSVYKTIIEDRNEYMAQKLSAISKHFPEATILAVVGAGHEKEINQILKNYLKP